MSARAIAVSWEQPAFAVSFSLYKKEAAVVTFAKATVLDITGYTLAFSLKQFHGDSSVLLAITPAITVAASGIFTVSFTSAQTSALPALQSYPFDIWRTDSGSETLFSLGLLTLLEEIR